MNINNDSFDPNYQRFTLDLSCQNFDLLNRSQNSLQSFISSDLSWSQSDLSQSSIDGFLFGPSDSNNVQELAFSSNSLVSEESFSNMPMDDSESIAQIRQSLERSIDNSIKKENNYYDNYSPSNLQIENVKFEHDSTPESSPTIGCSVNVAVDVQVNFLRSPIVRSKSAVVASNEIVPVTRPRSSTYPPPAPSNTRAVIGQIMRNSIQEDEFMDIAPYVTLPQHEAARKLNMPSSTLSKKWKDATINRKWPYRNLTKLDKDIATIMHNIHRSTSPVVDPELEYQLARLLQLRQAEVRPVIVRMN